MTIVFHTHTHTHTRTGISLVVAEMIEFAKTHGVDPIPESEYLPILARCTDFDAFESKLLTKEGSNVQKMPRVLLMILTRLAISSFSVQTPLQG